MALAISLGRRNLGQTSPNPSVGCVLVKNNVIVGRGYTATKHQREVGTGYFDAVREIISEG